MQVIHNEMFIPVDVDNTLVIKCDKNTPGAIGIVDPYDGLTKYRLPHKPHIRLLKNYKERGAFNVVWSKNGNRWAAAVVLALKLRPYIGLVSTKPFAYIDDKAASLWMGEHIYMQPDDEFGQE